MTNPLAIPRRIAMAGDWHGNTTWARRAINHAVAEGADVIVHLGDFGYEFRVTYLGQLARSPIPILFVDGNHECFPVLERYPIEANGLRKLTEQLWHMPRGFRWSWEGVRFLACGGAYSVDRQWRVLGESWWAGEEITDADVDRCVVGGRADVLIAHDCPSGAIIPTIDDRDGAAPWPQYALDEAAIHRRQLRRVVDAVQPRAIWHGHYHHAYAADADFGYGLVDVVGLDCDGTTLPGNVQIVDLDDIRIGIWRRVDPEGEALTRALMQTEGYRTMMAGVAERMADEAARPPRPDSIDDIRRRLAEIQAAREAGSTP